VRVYGADFKSAMPSDCNSADVGSTPTLVSILPSTPAAPRSALHLTSPIFDDASG
jgi:hypothetical protein